MFTRRADESDPMPTAHDSEDTTAAEEELTALDFFYLDALYEAVVICRRGWRGMGTVGGVVENN